MLSGPQVHGVCQGAGLDFLAPVDQERGIEGIDINPAHKEKEHQKKVVLQQMPHHRVLFLLGKLTLVKQWENLPIGPLATIPFMPLVVGLERGSLREVEQLALTLHPNPRAARP